jgi:cation transport ATPase
MDTLIAMGATVAYAYSTVALLGFVFGSWSVKPDLYFTEGTGLLALISLGHWLEARARHSAGSAIRELLDLAPSTALLVGRAGEGAAEDCGLRISDCGMSTKPTATATAAPGRRGSLASSPIRNPQSAIRNRGFGAARGPSRPAPAGDRVLVRPGDRVPTTAWSSTAAAASTSRC